MQVNGFQSLASVAAQSGIVVGDVIRAVNGTLLVNMNYDDSMRTITAAAGARPLTLTVLRVDQTFDPHNNAAAAASPDNNNTAAAGGGAGARLPPPDPDEPPERLDTSLRALVDAGWPGALTTATMPYTAGRPPPPGGQ